MKITRIGWVGKGYYTPVIVRDLVSDCAIIKYVFLNKGRKDSWDKKYWPPKKVRITVEDVE